MKSAVLKIRGRQYWVNEGDEVLVDRVPKGEKLDPKILLFVNDDKVVLGKPFVEKASVDFSVTEDVIKGDKTQVLKYKAKSRYRRRKGFRPLLTKIRISKISL